MRLTVLRGLCGWYFDIPGTLPAQRPSYPSTSWKLPGQSQMCPRSFSEHRQTHQEGAPFRFFHIFRCQYLFLGSVTDRSTQIQLLLTLQLKTSGTSSPIFPHSNSKSSLMSPQGCPNDSFRGHIQVLDQSEHPGGSWRPLSCFMWIWKLRGHVPDVFSFFVVKMDPTISGMIFPDQS